MIRAALLLCLALSASAQGFASLFNGRDLDPWLGDRKIWQVERSMLTGTSDGKSEAMLVFGGRDFGDFELRFDLRVHHGAGGVRMRGPGAGPLGVELEVGASVVRWLVSGSSFAVVSNVRHGEWNAYRIICKGGGFEVFHNDASSPYIITVGHLPPRGKLSLTLPAGSPSTVEFRNIRLKE